MTDLQFFPLTKTDNVAENRASCFEIQGHKVVVSQIKGEFFAVENECSHAKQTFDKGRVRGHKLLCPLHGAIFDIRDGSVLGPPAFRGVKTYPLKVEGDDILICLDDATE